MKPVEKEKIWTYIEAGSKEPLGIPEAKELSDVLHNRVFLRAAARIYSETIDFGQKALMLGQSSQEDLGSKLAYLSGQAQGMKRFIEGLLEETDNEGD